MRDKRGLMSYGDGALRKKIDDGDATDVAVGG